MVENLHVCLHDHLGHNSNNGELRKVITKKGIIVEYNRNNSFKSNISLDVVLCEIPLYTCMLSELVYAAGVNELTLIMLVPNLPIQNDAKLGKELKPWNMGIHLRVRSESFPTNTNKTGFR